MEELAPEAYLEIFLRTHAIVGARFGQVFADAGVLPPSEARVLTMISREPERMLRIDELSQKLGITKSGASRIVDRLERAGYVERQTSNLDRRAIYAVMTLEGRNALRNVTSVFRSVFADVFLSGLSKEELSQLMALLDRLYQANQAAALNRARSVQG